MDRQEPVLMYGAIPMVTNHPSSFIAPVRSHLGLVSPLRADQEWSPESLSWRTTNIPVLVSCFAAALATGGPTYAFGLYGATLKATLHLTQADLETLSSANFCAGLLSWIPGLAVDRLGPRKAMTLGGLTMALSLLGYWLVARQIIEVSSTAIVPTLSGLGICIFMSNSLVVGSLFKSIVLSCGLGTKGSAVGAAKGYLGLGAGVYSSLFDALRKPKETELDFLLLAAFFAVVAISLPAFTLLPRNGIEASDVSLPIHYRVAYAGLGILALSVVGSSAVFMFLPIEENEGEINEDNDGSFLRAALLLIAWFGPIGTLFFLPVAKQISTLDTVDSMVVYSPSKPRPIRLEHHVSARESKSNSAALGMTNVTLTRMLQTPSAYLLLWACTIVVGSGTMLTNNMGQMTEARGLPKRAAGACLALFSVAQAGARVATGALSESALSWQCVIPRPYFLIMSCLIGLIGHVWLAISSTRSMFVVGVILVGISFGMVWPLLVLVVGDVFGTTNHGANYMFYDGFTSAIGTVVISKYIAQGVYENHIIDEEETTCFGTACFQRTHWIVATLCLSAMVSSFVLSKSTKGLYVR